MTAGHRRLPKLSMWMADIDLSRGAAAVAILIALSACADKPAPLDNAYCRLYQRLPDPSDAIHLKKRENKVAILTNEQSWLDFCGSHNSNLKGI